MMPVILFLLGVLGANLACAQESMEALFDYERASLLRAIDLEMRRIDEYPRDDLSPEIRELQQALRERRMEMDQPFTTTSDHGPKSSRFSARIVNGVRTAAYPTVGALVYNGETVCSGNLIGAKRFVTAAHCFRSSDKARHYHVFLQHAGIRKVERFEFDEGGLDIAVVILDRPVTGIALTHLPTEMPESDSVLQIVGFGVTSGSSDDSGIKRQGGISTDPCPAGLDESFLCWSFNDLASIAASLSNICYRDSGSPVGTTGPVGLAIEHAVASAITPGSSCADSPLNRATSTVASRDWLQPDSQPVDLLSPPCCGTNSRVFARDGLLEPRDRDDRRDYELAIPQDVRTIRVSLNAKDKPRSELELHVFLPEPPAEVTCQDLGRYESCEYQFNGEPPSSWFVRVQNMSGYFMRYQLVVTMF